MMNDIINKMDTEELRNLVKHQADAISAYQDLCFTKDEVIRTLETLYRHRLIMEEARIRYEVKTSNLRHLSDRLVEKYDDPPACFCEAEGG